MYKRVAQLQPDPTKQKIKNGSFSRLFGRKTNHIERYEKKLEEIEENVRLRQSEASLTGEVCGNL
jgi:uncharacterized protein YaaN involved in tellurite resistance